MEWSVDNLKDQIPYYLTQEAKENLVKALENFPQNFPYYTLFHSDRVLQGDGWTSLGVVNFETKEHKLIKGIILSNSCDIDFDNKRDIPVRIVFAPILKLKSYAALLQNAGIGSEKIENKLNSIRDQQVTSLFYLPQGSGLEEEYIALLDDVHSVPLLNFLGQETKNKIYTLSQAGFYLFLLKLSVHFCRFHEGLLRDA